MVVPIRAKSGCPCGSAVPTLRPRERPQGDRGQDQPDRPGCGLAGLGAGMALLQAKIDPVAAAADGHNGGTA